MFNTRIVLKRDNNCIYMDCPFCDGMIPLDFNPIHDENQVRIKGICKKCKSYIHVRTHQYNLINKWEDYLIIPENID